MFFKVENKSGKKSDKVKKKLGKCQFGYICIVGRRLNSKEASQMSAASPNVWGIAALRLLIAQFTKVKLR